MGVFMYVVHGHCGPLGPYPGPHISWESHIFAGPDGGLVGLVGLVGSVLGFAFGGLDASFVGVGGLAYFLPAPRASSRCRTACHVAMRGGGKKLVDPPRTPAPAPELSRGSAPPSGRWQTGGPGL